MLKAFERALYVHDEGETLPRDLSKYKDDKWYDQFDGLKSSWNAMDNMSFGERRFRSSEKRKAVADVNEARMRQQKRHNSGGETRRESDPVEEQDEPES